MVDIATVSVVSSAAVALGTLIVNFVGGERQRKHESDLDFERRVWDEKSEGLFIAMKVSRNLLDGYEPITDENRGTYALNLSRRLDALVEVRPTIDAFASTECRKALAELIEGLTRGGVKTYFGRRHDSLLTAMMNLDVNDHSGWQRNKDSRDEAQAKAVEFFDPDLEYLHDRAYRLLEAARESVRRPKD